jgi:hypothetical protein
MTRAVPSAFAGKRVHPYSGKLSVHFMGRLALICLCVGTVLLVLLDWIGAFGYISLAFSKYTRAALLVIFVIYVISTGLSLGAYGFSFGRVLGFFMVINLTYSFLSDNTVDDLYDVSKIVFWVIGSVVAYRLTLAGALTEKMLRRTVIATVILGAAFTIMLMTNPAVEGGQNASAYLLVWCMPLLLLVKKSWVVNISIAVAVIAILLTVKRGAMIALVLSLVAYGLSYLIIHNNFNTFAKLAGSFIVIAIIGSFIISTKWNIIEQRFEDTSGSGRDKLYGMLFEKWVHSDPSKLIFGYGIHSVQRYTGQVFYHSENIIGPYAHSDWLQYMFDFGLFGVSFLVWLHVKFLFLIRKSLRFGRSFTSPLIMGYVILFLVNIYSGHLMGTNAIYLGLLLAYTSASMNYSKHFQNMLSMSKAMETIPTIEKRWEKS